MVVLLWKQAKSGNTTLLPMSLIKSINKYNKSLLLRKLNINTSLLFEITYFLSQTAILKCNSVLPLQVSIRTFFVWI